MAGRNMIAMAALEVAGLALIVVIVSMATEYWARQNLTHFILKESYWYGLWKVCQSSLHNERYLCIEITERAGWLKATQAAVCLDCIANLGGVVALALLTFLKSLPEIIFKILALVLMGMAIILSSIAILVFGKELKTDVGWSWGIMSLAMILQIVSLVLTVFVKRSEDPEIVTSS